MSNLQLNQWYWSRWQTPPGPEGTPTCLSVQQRLILSLYLSSASMGRGSCPTAQSTPWSPTALMELWLSSTFKAVTKGPTTVLSLTDLAAWALQLYFQYKVCLIAYICTLDVTYIYTDFHNFYMYTYIIVHVMYCNVYNYVCDCTIYTLSILFYYILFMC